MTTANTALLTEIETFLSDGRMAETTFGRKAVNDGKLVERLRGGASVTLSTAETIRAFIAAAGREPARAA